MNATGTQGHRTGPESNLAGREPPTPRPPRPGEVCIAVLLGADSFFGWIEASRLEAAMDAFEARFGRNAAERASREAHACLRHLVGAKLRSADEARDFGDWAASACAWLALRHPSHGRAIADAVDALSPRGCVLTCSIADDPRALRDTAWGFMVGDRIHDARAAMGKEPAHAVRMLSEDELRMVETGWTPPSNGRKAPSEWFPPKRRSGEEA